LQGRWLTPDSIPTNRVCRVLSIPASSEWLALVSGALLELTKEWNWEEFGSITAEQAAEEATSVFMDYYEERPCMIGAIIPYATSTLPTGTLACDGSTYNKSSYPALYDSLDSAYIVDATSFRVPDLRGRSIIGTGQGSGLSNRAIDASGGEETHILTVGEMPSHAHNYTGPIINPFSTPGPTPNFSASGPLAATTSTGGGSSHENMHPWRALKYAIVAR